MTVSTTAAAAVGTSTGRPGLPYFAAPVAQLVAQVAAELLDQLHQAGFSASTPQPTRRRPVTVEITVDRDQEGEIFWRAALRLEATGWIEPVDNDELVHPRAVEVLADIDGIPTGRGRQLVLLGADRGWSP